MKEIVATVTSKGQVTIPVEVRRHLGVGTRDKVAFVIADDGGVEVRRPRYTLESILGSIPPLPNETPDLRKEIEEATAEAADEVVRKMGGL